VNRVLATLEELLGRRIVREHRPPQPGDVRDTWADTGLAERLLGYRPAVPLREGLAQEVAWIRQATGHFGA
jgi:UDP-glucuronate 4-epimerase